MSSKPFYLNILCSPHGGIATYVLGLIQAQCHHGHSTGLAYNKSQSDPYFSQELTSIFEIEDSNILNLRTHKVPCLGTFRDLFSLYVYCRKLISSRDLILIAHGTSSAGLALIIKYFLPSSRFYYIPHGGLSHLYTSKNNFLRFCQNLDAALCFSGAAYLCESRYTFCLYDSIKSISSDENNLKGYIYSLPKDILQVASSYSIFLLGLFLPAYINLMIILM